MLLLDISADEPLLLLNVAGIGREDTVLEVAGVLLVVLDEPVAALAAAILASRDEAAADEVDGLADEVDGLAVDTGAAATGAS